MHPPPDNCTVFSGAGGEKAGLCPSVSLALLSTVTLVSAPWFTPVLCWLTQSLAFLETWVNPGSHQENRTRAR